MALKTLSWSEEIESVSSLPEYQNATIEIRNPLLTASTFDLTTNTFTQVGNPVVWTGRARIIGVRSALDIPGGLANNPTGSKTVRVQIPSSGYNLRVNRGFQIRVTDGGRNPILENYLLVVESDFNSGAMASRTFECSINLEVDPQWAALVTPPTLPTPYPSPTLTYPSITLFPMGDATGGDMLPSDTFFPGDDQIPADL